MKKRYYLGVIILQGLAFLPVWIWYAARLVDGSDEPWGLAALILAAIFSVSRRGDLGFSRKQLIASALLALAYLSLKGRGPMLLQALLAIFSVGALFLPRIRVGGSVVSFFALLLLSLPIIATLQFYLGYPVRLVTAQLCAWGLSLFGVEVVATGTALEWYGELVAVDAPCSGVKMLWAGMFLNFTLSAYYQLSLRQLWRAYYCSGLLIFIGNLTRTTVLFFTESGQFSSPDWFHQGLGVVLFSAVCFGIFEIHRKIRSLENESTMGVYSYLSCPSTGIWPTIGRASS